MAVVVQQATCSWCGGDGVARLRGAVVPCRCAPREAASGAACSAPGADTEWPTIPPAGDQ